MAMFDARSGGVLASFAMLGALALGACASPADEPARATLAGSETTETTAGPAPEIAPVPAEGETPVGGEPWDGAVTEACAAAVDRSFTEVAQSSDAVGVTSFWTRGRKWAACDVVGGSDPVVIVSAPGRPGFDERSLSLTTTVVAAGEEPAVRFVAAGLLPWPVDEISYTFPDGSTEAARYVTSQDDADDTFWAVTYTATEGPLVDPGTEAAELDPVTISIVGAAAEAFRLPWEELQRSE